MKSWKEIESEFQARFGEDGILTSEGKIGLDRVREMYDTIKKCQAERHANQSGYGPIFEIRSERYPRWFRDERICDVCNEALFPGSTLKRCRSEFKESPGWLRMGSDDYLRE